MSQEELANLIGVSQTTIHNIESGKVNSVDFEILLKVSNLLEVDLNEFIPDNYQVFFSNNNSNSQIQNGNIFNSDEPNKEKLYHNQVIDLVNTVKELVETMKKHIEILSSKFSNNI